MVYKVVHDLLFGTEMIARLSDLMYANTTTDPFRDKTLRGMLSQIDYNLYRMYSIIAKCMTP